MWCREARCSLPAGYDCCGVVPALGVLGVEGVCGSGKPGVLLWLVCVELVFAVTVTSGRVPPSTTSSSP